MARSTYFDRGRIADACPGSESGYVQRFQCGNLVKRLIWTRMLICAPWKSSPAERPVRLGDYKVESTLRAGELARLFKFACSDRFAPKAIAKKRKGKTPSHNVWGASGVATSVRHLDFFSARIRTGRSAIFLARPFQTTKPVRALTSRYRAKSSDLRFSGTTREIHQAVP
jgi:hypothetical protein